MVKTRRLSEYVDLCDAWSRAGRSLRAKRHAQAERLWRRALRAARSQGCLARLSRARLGPPVTPHFRTRARPADLVVRTRASRVRMSRRAVDGLVRLARPDLVVDVTRQRAIVGGEERSLEGLRLTLKVLATLLAAAGGPLPPEELFFRVWGRRYNPEFDRNTLNYHVSALRSRLAPLVGCRNGEYVLSADCRYVLVEAPSRDDRGALEELVKDLTVVDNHTLRARSGLSRVTALRSLQRLVAAGILVREGAGRGARYRVVRE